MLTVPRICLFVCLTRPCKIPAFTAAKAEETFQGIFKGVKKNPPVRRTIRWRRWSRWVRGGFIIKLRIIARAGWWSTGVQFQDIIECCFCFQLICVKTCQHFPSFQFFIIIWSSSLSGGRWWLSGWALLTEQGGQGKQRGRQCQLDNVGAMMIVMWEQLVPCV